VPDYGFTLRRYYTEVDVAFLAARARAISPAAAPPKRRSIGGAGTSFPLEPPLLLEPPWLLEPFEEDDVEVEVDVDVVDPPKLEDVLVLLDTLPDEVEVLDTLPEELEELETLPDELDVLETVPLEGTMMIHRSKTCWKRRPKTLSWTIRPWTTCSTRCPKRSTNRRLTTCSIPCPKTSKIRR
jgi:hypothetical protein